jgi:hypothetical protein
MLQKYFACTFVQVLHIYVMLRSPMSKVSNNSEILADGASGESVFLQVLDEAFSKWTDWPGAKTI